MRIATLPIAFAVLVGTSIASADDDPYYQPYTYDDSALPGEAISDVDVFYDQLSQFGVWVDEPRLGRVFIPDIEGYVPYTNGRWQYTNVGFVWISDEPFAWATSHYGRWAFSPAYGRWVWVPGIEWGPAWVEWRESGDVFGWAPLPPVGVADIYAYAPPIDAWRYVRADYLFDRDLRYRYLPRDRVTVIHRDARPITARATIGRHQVVVGPPARRLREHRVDVRPQRLEARAVGRFTPTESRAAVDRARERRTTIDERNRRRVESNAPIRDAERRVTRDLPPRRVEPQPPRAQPQPPRAEPRPEPDRVKPERAQPPRAEPRPEPDRVRPPRAEPERAQPQPPRAEPRPEPDRVRPPRAEPERAQPQSPRAEPQRAEPPRREPDRVRPPRAEPERAQPPKPEAPRAQQAPRRAEPQRPEPPKRESQRAEPRQDQRADARPERARPQPDRAKKEPDRKGGRSERD